jgi:thiol:disulfide interchange protein DsbC
MQAALRFSRIPHMKHRYPMLLAVLLPLVACAQDKEVALAATVAAAQAPATRSATTAAVAIPAADPRAVLAAKIPGARPEDLRATPVPGIFELTHGSDISYVTADANYVFAGDMYRVSNTGDFPNLSEVRRRELRLNALGTVPESRMIVFGDAKAAHTVTVFTDVDCSWCQRLHSQIAEYNRLGIRVRYLFYPRSGPGTPSWAKADAVWCSADRRDALTRAKRGEALSAKACPTPVASDYQLGEDVGIDGRTPGLVLENGELVPGYLSPPQLLAHIQQSNAQTASEALAQKQSN